MKKLALFSAVAASALLAMSASAAPNGYETVNFHAVLNVQNSSKIVQVSMGDKDLLNLIHKEFTSITIPSGAQLVTRGMSSEEFTVLTAGGSVVISDASFSGFYELYFYPDEDREIDKYVPGSTDTYDYMSDEGYFFYRDATDTYTMFLRGAASWTSNFANDNESYDMPYSSGTFYLPVGIGSDSGVCTGGISGSGINVGDIW